MIGPCQKLLDAPSKGKNNLREKIQYTCTWYDQILHICPYDLINETHKVDQGVIL